MPRDFYPFVEEEGVPSRDEGHDGLEGEGACEVQHPARIAVYDDAAAAPRVVVIEPKPVREYLEEITATVSRLAREQGGSIPFMVIREVVENFIHAFFKAPTITILDGGETIRFSDQGPGIKEKDLALEYGTTSATEEMRQYIRGVGSGLPYVQQYMVDKGGSLEIEDNISGGTVVTISTLPSEPPAGTPAYPQPSAPYGQAAAPQPWGAPAWAPQPQQPWQGYGAYPPATGAYPSQPYYPQQAAQPFYPQQVTAPMPQTPPAGGQQPFPPAPGTGELPVAMPQVTLDDRGRQALSYLAGNGSGGPTELVRTYGASSATWSRVLNSLAAQGLVGKAGQKYQLTGIGRGIAAGL